MQCGNINKYVTLIIQCQYKGTNIIVIFIFAGKYEISLSHNNIVVLTE